MHSVIKKIGYPIYLASLLALAFWAALAIHYSNLPEALRPWCAGLFLIGSLILLIGKFSTTKTRFGFCAVFLLILIWWLQIPPSNNRDWKPCEVKLPHSEQQGYRITINNIRNCDYRTETDYTVHYYPKSFELSEVKSLDLSIVHWGSPYIAHTMLSFGFSDSTYLCFSIEARKEQNESYSPIKGFFRQYELFCVVGDERDLIGLRTNYRGEQVFLYRLNATPEFIQNVLLDYLRELNTLETHPRWYNSLTTNCTTGIRTHTAPYNPDILIDWRIVVNGLSDEMLYNMHRIDTTLPFPLLQRVSLVNDRAKWWDKSPDFSNRIRAGLPGMK